jgi:aspartate 1-decarboxylase
LPEGIDVQVCLLKGKIHRCTVTDADLDYEGSVTISSELMEAARIGEHEQVHIWNVSNGARVTTYAMSGRQGSGVICVNGAAAHLMRRGDIVIIAAFAMLEETEARGWQPSVVLVEGHNRIKRIVPARVSGTGLKTPS